MTTRPPAGDRLRRLLAILPWLADRGAVPISELASQFEMPESEVVALLELAACCGLPPYTPDQLIELIVTAGWYHAIAYLCNGLAIGSEPWAQRFPAG